MESINDLKKGQDAIRTDIASLKNVMERKVLSDIHEIHGDYEKLLHDINLNIKDIDPISYDNEIKCRLNNAKLWNILIKDKDYPDVLLYLRNGFAYIDLIFSERIRLHNLKLFECTPLAIEFFKALETFLYIKIKKRIQKKPMWIWIGRNGVKSKKVSVRSYEEYKPTFGYLLGYINRASIDKKDSEIYGAGTLLKDKIAKNEWCDIFPNNVLFCKSKWGNKCKYYDNCHCIKYDAEKWLNEIRNSKVHKDKMTMAGPENKTDPQNMLNEIITQTLKLFNDFDRILK